MGHREFGANRWRFLSKANTLYFRLCKHCEFMMCILIVNHQFNRMHPWCYVLSCRLTSGPLWLGIYHFLWWFLFVVFWLFVLHWRYELPCQDKLPEFHYTPILGCIRVLWLVFHPLGLELDKALFGWNSVTPLCLGIEVICISLPEK